MSPHLPITPDEIVAAAGSRSRHPSSAVMVTLLSLLLPFWSRLQVEQQLVAENVLLRHQVMVLRRKVKVESR